MRHLSEASAPYDCSYSAPVLCPFGLLCLFSGTFTSPTATCVEVKRFAASRMHAPEETETGRKVKVDRRRGESLETQTAIDPTGRLFSGHFLCVRLARFSRYFTPMFKTNPTLPTVSSCCVVLLIVMLSSTPTCMSLGGTSSHPHALPCAPAHALAHTHVLTPHYMPVLALSFLKK